MEMKLLKQSLCTISTSDLKTAKNHKKMSTVAGHQHKGKMKIWPKFSQLLTSNQCMTTDHCANSKHSWHLIHMGSEHSERLSNAQKVRARDRERVLCVRAKFVLCIQKEDRMEIRKVTAVEV
jgi:hypothetical protein